MGERETDEWKFKLQNITDMLVAAGYFRARISSLDAFDKIVGGMVWAITNSSVSVNVDVVFQENLAIGQKIRLSENIVSALVTMKCPIRLRSHQIQGLDLENLFPVIQWLVKSVISYQQITGNLVRAYAELQYDTDFASEYFDSTQKEDGENYSNQLQSSFLANRQFRKPAEKVGLSQNVDATLLEYGHKFVWNANEGEEEEVEAASSPKRSNSIANKAKALGGKLGMGGPSKAEQKALDQEEAQKLAEERVQKLKDTLEKTETKTKLSTKNMMNLIDTEAVQQQTQAYEEVVEEADDIAEFSGKRDAEYVFNRKKEQLEKEMTVLVEKREEKKTKYKAIIEEIETLEENVEEFKTTNTSYVEQIQEVEKQEQKTDNKALLLKLKGYVQLNEALKAQERAFKAACKKQLGELQKLVKSVEQNEDSEESARIAKIDAMFKADKKKYDKVRKVLASRNQDIARIRRKMDGYPSRAELLQYEKRFVELYAQSEELLKETRKYYDLYNTLQVIYEKMQNEVQLLESIKTQFEGGLSQQARRTQFSESFGVALQGVEKALEHYEKEHDMVKVSLEAKRQQYNKLANRQRKYFMAVKDFQKEIERNEDLMAAMEEKQA